MWKLDCDDGKEADELKPGSWRRLLWISLIFTVKQSTDSFSFRELKVKLSRQTLTRWLRQN